MDFHDKVEKGPDTIPLSTTSVNVPRHLLLRRIIRTSIYVTLVLVIATVISTSAVSSKCFYKNHISGHQKHDYYKHGHRLSKATRFEKLFLSIPSKESAAATSRAYATHPHLAGSPEDFSDAKVILKLFQDEFNITTPTEAPIFSAGSPESQNATLLLSSADAPTKASAWIDVYYPILNTPLKCSLEIIGENGDPIWTANLVEDGDARDEDAHKYRDAVPSWHGLSFDGDITGQLVYVNYGLQEDYEELVEKGVNFTDKIVLTRYGKIFRGLKVQAAEKFGAVGILIYSDPRDDGFVTVSNGYSPFPAGPARNPTSVQRGSVQYLSSYPGDPSTPGYPAYEYAKRVEGGNIPRIPSLPLSWQNAERLLKEIGPVYEELYTRGKRHLSGKVSGASIRLVNRVDTKVTPIWNTMASIPGHIRDEVVIIACHRDAWILGAADPVSGTVSLHEIIRGFGALVKKGWKPLRTVVFASWDAEEYGLIGSTEWGEDFPSWISDNVVAYLNVDISVSGSRWSAKASPSLANLIKEVALEIPHPTDLKKSLWDARDDVGPFFGVENEDGMKTRNIDIENLNSYTEDMKLIQASRTGIMPLGSGSDYTVFLQRLGIASSDQGFQFTPSDAVYHYHSIYDTHHWQKTYADPDFSRHVAVAKHLGLLALRLIDSVVVPLNTTQYALELSDYLDRVESLQLAHNLNFTELRSAIANVQLSSIALDKEKFAAEKHFKKLLRVLLHSRRRSGKCSGRTGFHLRIANWVKGVFGVPLLTEQELDNINIQCHQAFSWQQYLSHQVTAEMVTNEADERFAHAQPVDHRRPPLPLKRFVRAANRVVNVNKKIISFEHGFISEEGIKDRQWYKHLGVAPGKLVGYGATTFPGLTEALAIDKNVTFAQYEAVRLTDLLNQLAKNITPKSKRYCY